MALTAYQKQYKRRATKALALYAKAGKLVRALVGQLVAAEQGNAAATARIARLNTLYGTALPAATDLMVDFGPSETLANLATLATNYGSRRAAIRRRGRRQRRRGATH